MAQNPERLVPFVLADLVIVLIDLPDKEAWLIVLAELMGLLMGALALGLGWQRHQLTMTNIEVRYETKR